jgi:hypothetical protein
MPLYRNGGLIGSRPTTSDDSARGVWSLNDHFNAQREGQWPAYIPPDPNYADVVYLARFENNLTDQKGVLSPTTNGVVGYTSIRKFGLFSLAKISGANFLTLAGNLNTPLAFGTGDFTVEFWIQFPGNPPNNNNFGLFACNVVQNGTPGAALALATGVTANNTWKVSWYNGNTITVYQHTGSLNPGQWYHLSFCRASGTQYVSINGVVENKGSNTHNITTTSGSRLGSDAFNQNAYTAYFDEVRVTKGVARYTANFDVPVTRFPNY